VLRYFIQELHMNIKIRAAAAAPMIIETVQVVVRTMDLILGGQRNAIKGKPIDTSTGQRVKKLKGTCNWCGYKGYFKHEYRQKAAGRSRKVSSSSTPNTSHSLLKCFYCGREDHHVADCKTKVVFSAEELEFNKNDLVYVKVYEKKEVMGGLSKIRGVLRKERWKSSYSNDSLFSSKIILLPTPKLVILPSDMNRLSEMAGMLREEG
jgi:hypothetical protein